MSVWYYTKPCIFSYLLFSFLSYIGVQLWFPGVSVVKNATTSAGDVGLIPGSGRSPGEGNGNALQYSCREIPRTEEPGGLDSMGLQRVGHNLATK